MTRKHSIPDKGSVGRSDLVPFKEGEDRGSRHERRKGHANSNVNEVRQWCQERSINFSVTNGGHHWRFVREKTQCEWWPSSAKFVVNQQWKKGLHVHDYKQLMTQLVRNFGNNKTGEPNVS